jgi:hypothetical protein
MAYSGAMAEPDPQRNDSSVHMITIARYDEGPDGGSVRRELSLAEEAETLAAALARAQANEADLENDWRTGQVIFSRGRGLVLGILLEELAARVRPGFTGGPIRGGDELAELAAELAATLEAKRQYSHDYD